MQIPTAEEVKAAIASIKKEKGDDAPSKETVVRSLNWKLGMVFSDDPELHGYVALHAMPPDTEMLAATGAAIGISSRDVFAEILHLLFIEGVRLGLEIADVQKR